MKNTNPCPYLLLIFWTFFSCNQNTQNKLDKNIIDLGWKPVYQNDEYGNRLQGNIDSLIAGIRKGYDVRIGWGWKKNIADSIVRLEHMADPLFLTIIQEKDVSIVIDGHPLLNSYIDPNNQKIGEGGHIWQCVLTSKGTFNAKVYHRKTEELIKDWPQRHKMTWFLEYPNNSSKNNKPLFN